jgi:hypothetical protein
MIFRPVIYDQPNRTSSPDQYCQKIIPSRYIDGRRLSGEYNPQRYDEHNRQQHKILFQSQLKAGLFVCFCSVYHHNVIFGDQIPLYDQELQK